MKKNFDVQKLARDLHHKTQRDAEIARGQEIVARNFLDQTFNPETTHKPGNKVSDYNRQLWASNKNREDFK